MVKPIRSSFHLDYKTILTDRKQQARIRCTQHATFVSVINIYKFNKCPRYLTIIDFLSCAYIPEVGCYQKQYFSVVAFAIDAQDYVIIIM